MADARQQAAWDRTLSLLAVGAMLSKDPPRPVEFIPARYRPPPPRPPAPLPAAVLGVESKAAWQLMHQYFRGGRHGR